MNKYKILMLILLSISIIIIGCQKNDTPKDVENEPEVIEEVETVEETTPESPDEIFEKLYVFDNGISELIAFVDMNIVDVDADTATTWIDNLEQKLVSEQDNRIDKIFEVDTNFELMEIDGNSRYFSEGKIDEIKNEELRIVVQENFDTFHRFVNVEGSFYPIIDYNKLSKYNDKINPELADYFNIMAMDSENLPFSDGGRTITIEDLQNRIVRTEVYLNNYPSGIRTQEMINQYRQKLNAYMGGLPNTPIFSFDKKYMILEEVMDSFREVAALENLATAQIMSKYINDIENNDFVIDDSILSKVEAYVDEAVELIKK